MIRPRRGVRGSAISGLWQEPDGSFSVAKRVAPVQAADEPKKGPIVKRHTRAALLAAVFGLYAPAAVLAQSVKMAASVAPLASTVRVVGEADPASTVQFQVALRLRDFSGLSARLQSRGRISPAELASSHFPTQQDHDAVVAWLKSAGLTVETTVPSRMTITVSGRADTVSRALDAHLSHVVSEGQDYVSADSEPSVPPELAGIVLSINGLQPQHHAHYQHVLGTAGPGSVPYIPSDLLNAYQANGLGTGSGTTTAIVIDTFPKKADLTQFWSAAKVSQSLSNITFIQAVAGTLPGLSGEESLDVEYSSSMGASSKVRVYASRSLSDANLDTTFQRVISDLQSGVKITQVSISLGECETDESTGELSTDDQYFATMTALGASVFVSTGDSGSQECGGGTNTPSFYSTSPHVAAAGGTSLKLSGTTVVSETGWVDSGGGISTYFAKPSYQSGLAYSKRAVPDLSADADPNTGVLVIVNGQQNQFGGTSVSSPVLAGLIGLVNAKRIAAGKGGIGLLDTYIYPLLGTTSFRDIKSGNNGGYSAKVGYDLVTGIGAPLLKQLLPKLLAD